jgi:hypothetical protein
VHIFALWALDGIIIAVSLICVELGFGIWVELELATALTFDAFQLCRSLFLKNLHANLQRL